MKKLSGCLISPVQPPNLNISTVLYGKLLKLIEYGYKITGLMLLYVKKHKGYNISYSNIYMLRGECKRVISAS